MVDETFPKGRVIFMVTGNIHKFNEARKLLAGHEIATAMLRIKAPEIQDDALENIAKASVLAAVKKSNLPVIVEDAGLFIRALKDFPGPYSSYVFRTIGKEGILKLMRNIEDRYAQFRSVVAYCAPREPIKVFKGIVEGRITHEARGSSGFGFDPIFEPFEGQGETFGEMSITEKNRFSHRSRALRKFAEWYKSSFSKAFKYRGTIALKEPSEPHGE